MSLHISAQPGEIAPVVLMPGDPLRAKFIAEHFLNDFQLVSHTRNIYFYTGFYKGKRISIGASGMGCPSIGIYSFELFNEYDVDCIIRIGTCGAYTTDLKLFDLVNADAACSESTYASGAFGIELESLPHQGKAFDIINQTAEAENIPVHSAPIHSSDVFYRSEKGIPPLAQKYNCPAVEMEAFALFANAIYLKKTAASLLTVSDVIPTGEHISSNEREKSLEKMIRLALDAGIEIN